jgi:hypothetical protein
LRVPRLIPTTIAAVALIAAPAALAAGGGGSGGPGNGGAGLGGGSTSSSSASSSKSQSGGSGLKPGETATGPLHPTVQGMVAKIIHGIAYAPAEAPLQVQEAIWAGNQIRFKPYIFGGGHQSFRSPGYDCSGSVSYVLHAAGLLKTPFDSVQFFGWGKHGYGQWITVYTNSGHAFIQIAGIRFDTSTEGENALPRGTAPGTGPRWRPVLTREPGFQPRYMPGY